MTLDEFKDCWIGFWTEPLCAREVVGVVCGIVFVGAAWSPFILMLCGATLPGWYGMGVVLAAIGAGIVHEAFG